MKMNFFWKASESISCAWCNAVYCSVMVGSQQAECATESLMQYKGELTVVLKYIPAERNLSLPLDQIQGSVEKCYWIQPINSFLLIVTFSNNVLQCCYQTMDFLFMHFFVVLCAYALMSCDVFALKLIYWALYLSEKGISEREEEYHFAKRRYGWAAG